MTTFGKLLVGIGILFAVPVVFVMMPGCGLHPRKEGTEYYKHVDEVTSNLDGLRGMRLQVHGNVVDGSIEQAKGTLLYRFKIESRAPRAPAVITATYDGLVPDSFKSGAEIVAKGTLSADNQLQVVPDGIMAQTTQTTGPAPTSKQELDPLDVLPSKTGELQIKRAWRTSAVGVTLVNGQYEWEGTGATVTLSCSFPPSDVAPCDKSLPTRMKFGKIPACGSSKDEDGTGPLIMWHSCTLQISGSGVEIPKRFERLKAAAAEAVPWTEKIFASTANVDMDAVLKNRDDGLLYATRIGNVTRNLDISHQLDIPR